MTSIISREEWTAEDLEKIRRTETINDSHFGGWPLAEINEPFLKINLERTYKTVKMSFARNKHTIGFNVNVTTVRKIQSETEFFNHYIINAFLCTLHKNIRERQKALLDHVPGTTRARLGYLWRADNAPAGFHRTYYLMLLMNSHAFDGHDHYGSDTNQLKRQICKAWAGVNETSPERAVRLIQYPGGDPIRAIRNEPETQGELFKRASLLSRTYPNDYRIGAKLFGASY